MYFAGMFAGKYIMEIISTLMNAIFQGAHMVPFVAIIFFVIKLFPVIIKIIELIPLLLNIALEILDPEAFIKDVIFGIVVGIEKLLSGIVDILFGKMKSAGGNIPGFSGMFKEGVLGSNKSKNSYCIKPSFFNLILMVLCPPFAVFKKYGIIRGWIWIIICTILTYYCYYFPGLLFASLHTLCF